MRKKILITYDVEDWAYHKNAKILQKYLQPFYDIEIISDQDKRGLLAHVNTVTYDLLFLQWFPDVDIFYRMYRLPYPVVTQVTSSVFFKMHSEGWNTLFEVPLIVSKSRQYYEKLRRSWGKRGLGWHITSMISNSFSRPSEGETRILRSATLEGIARLPTKIKGIPSSKQHATRWE